MTGKRKSCDNMNTVLRRKIVTINIQNNITEEGENGVNIFKEKATTTTQERCDKSAMVAKGRKAQYERHCRKRTGKSRPAGAQGTEKNSLKVKKAWGNRKASRRYIQT